MAKQEKDTLYVIAAAYDNVDDAVADYEAVKALYREVKSSHDFDASVIAKDEKGKVPSSRSTSSRPGTALPSGWAGAWRPVWPWRCSRPSPSASPEPEPRAPGSGPWPATHREVCPAATSRTSARPSTPARPA